MPLGHPELVGKPLSLPPRAEAVIEMQIEGSIRVSRKPIKVTRPDSPDFVKALGTIDGEDNCNFVWRHSCFTDCSHSSIVEVAQS
jgi:hypothetical protein